MLKLLRNKKTAKKIWIVLAIIILPAFIFWGFGGAMRDKNEKGYIGKISGKKISSILKVSHSGTGTSFTSVQRMDSPASWSMRATSMFLPIPTSTALV